MTNFDAIKSSLNKKLLGGVLLLSGLATLLIVGVQLTMEYRADVDTLNASLEMIETSHLDTLTTALYNLDDELINSAIGGIRTIQDVEYIEIVEDSWKRKKGQITSENTVERKWELTYSNAGTSEKIGSLRVVASLDRILTKLKDKTLFIIATQMAKSLTVSIMILIFFQVVVTRHLSKIVNYLASYDRGDTHEPLSLRENRKVGRRRPDELDKVVESINNTHKKLNTTLDILTYELEEKTTAEANLNLAFKYIEGILDSLSEILLVVDETGRIIRHNKNTSKILGYTSDEIEKIELQQIITAKNSETPLFGRDTREAFVEDAFCITNNNKKIPVSISISALDDSEKHMTVLSIRDMRESALLKELRETQDQLITASRDAGMADIATGVIHKIGNVLNSVNTSVTTIENLNKKNPAERIPEAANILIETFSESRAALPPKFTQATEYIKLAARAGNDNRDDVEDEINNLTHHIALIGRVISNQQKFTNHKTFLTDGNIISIVDEIVTDWQKDGDPKIHINKTFESKAINGKFDNYRIKKIMESLLDNADEALQNCDQKTVSISCDTEGDEWVVLSTTDNGPGVPDEIRSQIFNFGYSTKPDALGCGLHDAANAAFEMGGKLLVKRQKEATGSTFALYLPLKKVA